MADSRKPDFKIYVGGNPIKDEYVAAVIQVTVDDAVNAAALATIKFRDDGAKVSDKGPFKIGAEVVIHLGYVGATEQVFLGEVTAHKASFPRRGNQTLLVIAQDKFHRLRRNQRQKTFLEMKVSDAIAQVASNAEGISSSDAEATAIKQDSILQWNQTDADFVLEQASLLGYEAFVDEAKLVFRKPKVNDAAVITIKWHAALRHFSTSVSLHRQQKELKVGAWNMLDKAAIIGSAAVGQERDLMGGSVSGGKALDEGGLAGEPQAEHQVPAKTQDEVDGYAESLFQKRADQFLQGEGTAEGNPKIRRGTVVELDGLGQFLSGNYYVHRAIHTLLIGSGYTTTFRVYRSAVLAPAEPPQSAEVTPAEPEPIETSAEGEPMRFEVAAPDGAPLEGAPAVLVDPDGNRQDGTLSSDGAIDIEFEEQ